MMTLVVFTFTAIRDLKPIEFDHFQDEKTSVVKAYYQKLRESLQASSDIAYRYYDEAYSYAELNRAMLQINALINQYQNKSIVLYSHKSFQSYAAVYASILSGNIWVPLSPSLPVERGVEILNMLDVGMVLIDSDLPPELQEHCEQTNIPSFDLRTLTEHSPTLDIAAKDFNPHDIAYIMFTSGSTGKPKGVPMTHLNYINFAENCFKVLDFKSGDVFSDYHDFGFDISIFYLFCFPLLKGVIAPVKTAQDQVLPMRFMQENQVTVWSSVPSVITRIQQVYPDGAESSVRIMFLCGEPFALGVLKYCWQGLKVGEVFNFYGLTETGVENFYHPCKDGDVEKFEPYGYVPIGTPLPGNQVDVSENGELLLSGCQITPGYLGGIGEDRFFKKDGNIWFHTGDIVERVGENYFCKGRMDTQIKLRGYRIELMDVEVNLTRLPEIKDAICFPVKHEERTILVAVVIPEGDAKVRPFQLKKDVTHSLPSYMVPDRYFITDSFPVNANGKKNRKVVRETYTQELKSSP